MQSLRSVVFRARFRTYALALVSATALTACGSEGEDTSGTRGASSAPASSSGFPEDQLPDRVLSDLPLVAPTSDLDIPIFSDIVEIAPGEDVTFCTFSDVILDEATIFGESFGAQSPQGHHAILQYTTTPQEPHTGPCGAMDGQMLLGGTGGQVADEPTLPENFGVEVPAGAQLVMNHHWINTTPDTIEGQSMMLARRLERGGDTVLAGNMIMLSLGWEIPPQQAYEYTTECTYGADVPYVYALGHMHEWGSNVRVEIDRVGGTTETLFDTPWSPEAATGIGSANVYSLEQPFMMHAGDTVRLTCNWENDTAEAIGFPREMCIFFGYTIGANYVCVNGSWLTADEASAGGMGSTDIAQHL